MYQKLLKSLPYKFGSYRDTQIKYKVVKVGSWWNESLGKNKALTNLWATLTLVQGNLNERDA